MADISLLSMLSLATIAIVLILGVVQFFRVRNSQAKRGEAPGGMAGPSDSDNR